MENSAVARPAFDNLSGQYKSKREKCETLFHSLSAHKIKLMVFITTLSWADKAYMENSAVARPAFDNLSGQYKSKREKCETLFHSLSAHKIKLMVFITTLSWADKAYMENSAVARPAFDNLSGQYKSKREKCETLFHSLSAHKIKLMVFITTLSWADKAYMENSAVARPAFDNLSGQVLYHSIPT